MHMFLLIFWLVFCIVFVGTLLILGAIQHSNLSNIKRRQEGINNKANIAIQNTEFKQSKIFYLNDYATYNQNNFCKKYIAVDSENKKICLVDYLNGSLLIVGFDEILNYEIYENGSQQIVGGNVNGFWSGVFAAETTGNCKELKLIIRLNRYDISQVCYEIIFNTPYNSGIQKTNKIYKQCINSLQEVVSFLEVVKNENIKK